MIQNKAKDSLKEEFIKTLSSVKREGINELIVKLEETTFFDDPASAKFHGNWEGGLCEHSLLVYKKFVELTGRDDDTVKIACLLHDVCKAGTYDIVKRNVKNPDTGKWEEVEAYDNKSNGFPFGHGEKSVYWISQFIKLTDEEALMIRWHMGAYEGEKVWRDLGEAQKLYPSVLYIHFADMLASNMGI